MFLSQKKIHLGNTPTASYFSTQLLSLHFRNIFTQLCGSGSSVGIATDYGLDVTGSNPGGERDFPPVQTGPGAHPASCKMGTGSFPGDKVRPGSTDDHSPPSSAAVMEQ